MAKVVAGLFMLTVLDSAVVAYADDDTDEAPVGWVLTETQGFHPPPRDSASVFDIPGNDAFGIFGGYSEALDISGTTSPTSNTFFNDLFIFDASSRTWTRRSSGEGPAPRGFACAVYHEGTESVLVFGGSHFEADFSAFTYFDDLWRFDLSTNEWTEIQPVGPRPLARAGCGCDIIGDGLFVFSGNGENFSTDNELWRYDIVSQSWARLQADDVGDPSRPAARTQMIFIRIPTHNKFLMIGGDAFVQLPHPPFLDARTQEDVWIYDANRNHWTEFAPKNTPEPARNHRAYAMISERLLLVQNGDAQSDATTQQTCPPPLSCLIPPTPTNDTFVYDIKLERWTEIGLSPGTVPPTRRSTMRRVGETLYLFGGYGWDGDNAVGKVTNPYTWELDLGQMRDDD
ncbi:MAG: kelch repeat-containing protein [Cyanobacteria bacterium P01_F01_bin.33]